ncbi:MAG: hypothetical protein ACFB6R_18010 [Alphaproteobacteria bacterium]
MTGARPAGGLCSSGPGALAIDPVAVVDIGSNSIRLVIFEGLTRAPGIVFNEKVGCELGRDVAAGRPFSEDRLAQAMAVFARFSVITRFYGVVDVMAVATAAVRDAHPETRADFLARAEAALGHSIRVLSEEEEGWYAAAGVLSGWPEAEGIVGDLGGGSVELVRIAGGRVREAVSLPLGVLRLSASGDDTPPDDSVMARRVRDALATVPWLSQTEGHPFYAVGGNWRNIARAHMNYHAYPINVLHGYGIPARDVSVLLKGMQRGEVRVMGAVSTLKKRRQEFIRTASIALDQTIKATGARSVIVSGHGVREGLIFDALQGQEKAEDPLLAGAYAMARRMARTMIDDDHVSEWLAPLFDDPNSPFAPDPEAVGERRALARLRRAATIVADIGWGFHSDTRASRTADLIMTAPFYGIDHPGRAFLGLTLWYRYTRITTYEGLLADVMDLRRPALPDYWVDHATALGHALHLAFELTGGAPNLLHQSRLSLTDAGLTLTLNGPTADLYSYDVRKRLEHLARSAGIKTHDIRVER